MMEEDSDRVEDGVDHRRSLADGPLEVAFTRTSASGAVAEVIPPSI
jgi:hypothetical protein